jgi:hypothetical protein
MKLMMIRATLRLFFIDKVVVKTDLNRFLVLYERLIDNP